MSRYNYQAGPTTARRNSAPAKWNNAESLGAANEHRRRDAASRQSMRARNALDVLASVNLSTSPVWRRRWLEVLQRRAGDTEASLAELAARMSPPMTKSAFSCQLDRACRFAEEVADAASRETVGERASSRVTASPYDLASLAAPVRFDAAHAVADLAAPGGGHR